MADPGRVLIIDDTIAVLQVLGEHFTDLGFRVQLSNDGRDILARMRHFRPDVVLLDLRLPGLSGEDIFTILRLHDPTIPVVIISANTDADFARHLLQHGAFDYVTKPFSFAYLDRVVDTALALRAVRELQTA